MPSVASPCSGSSSASRVFERIKQSRHNDENKHHPRHQRTKTQSAGGNNEGPGDVQFGLVFAVGLAFAGKVHVAYDKDYDPGKIRSFAWKDTVENSVASANPLLHSRIVNGIEYYLTLAGWREDETAPSVYVTYHTSTEKEVVLDTSHFGYGYPVAWGYYGRAYPIATTSVTTVHTYEKGTLVVDVWDAATNKLVWRGTATNITVTDNPTKMEKKIDKALDDMVNTWRKIKPERAK